MIILTLFLLLFLTTTVLLGWFCYKVVSKLMFVSDNLTELYQRLEEFDQHINFIYELEMYYGDETLKNLIRHSRDLRNYMNSYKNIMEASGEDAPSEDLNGEQDTDEPQEETDEDKERFATATGKTLFYS